MIRVRHKKRDALYSMLRAWRSYGTGAFTVSRFGEHWGPLHDAEQCGWATFIGDRCRLTRVGIEQLIPHGAKLEAEVLA